MQTRFRRGEEWSQWKPDSSVLQGLVELCTRTWPDSASWRLEIDRAERADTAETAEEAFELIDAAGVLSATERLELHVSLIDDARRESLSFSWWNARARLTVAANDEIVAGVLQAKAAGVLAAGVCVDLPAPPPDADAVRARLERSFVATVEEQTLSLARVRFVGTYADLCQLIRDAAEQLREVVGTADFVYIALTEHPTRTVRVQQLDELSRIEERAPDKFRHLSVVLTHRDTGTSLLLYFSRRRAATSSMGGSVSGPNEAQLRTLRASTNDLLHSRCRSARLVPTLRVAGMILGLGTVVAAVFALDIIVVVLLTVCMWTLLASPFYLPEVELLSPGEKTRWSRWSRYVLGLIVSAVIGLVIRLATR